MCVADFFFLMIFIDEYHILMRGRWKGKREGFDLAVDEMVLSVVGNV